jgi:hypothetical protein
MTKNSQFYPAHYSSNVPTLAPLHPGES